MGLFKRAPSATLVGEELQTAIAGLEHSATTLNERPDAGQADRLAAQRRSSLAARLRRAL